MKVVASTDTYTILQRRDGRYAVVNQDKQPINGDEKVTILLEHDLIKAAAPKVVEEESSEEAAAEDAGADGEEGDAAEE